MEKQTQIKTNSPLKRWLRRIIVDVLQKASWPFTLEIDKQLEKHISTALSDALVDLSPSSIRIMLNTTVDQRIDSGFVGDTEAIDELESRGFIEINPSMEQDSLSIGLIKRYTLSSLGKDVYSIVIDAIVDFVCQTQHNAYIS